MGTDTDPSKDFNLSLEPKGSSRQVHLASIWYKLLWLLRELVAVLAVATTDLVECIQSHTLQGRNGTYLAGKKASKLIVKYPQGHFCRSR